MKFCITDRRPWYKQVVGGILYSVALLIAVPTISLIGILLYSVILYLGVVGIVWGVFKVLGAVILIIGLMVTAAILVEWAFDT